MGFETLPQPSPEKKELTEKDILSIRKGVERMKEEKSTEEIFKEKAEFEAQLRPGEREKIEELKKESVEDARKRGERVIDWGEEHWLKVIREREAEKGTTEETKKEPELEEFSSADIKKGGPESPVKKKFPESRFTRGQFERLAYKNQEGLMARKKEVEENLKKAQEEGNEEWIIDTLSEEPHAIKRLTGEWKKEKPE